MNSWLLRLQLPLWRCKCVSEIRADGILSTSSQLCGFIGNVAEFVLPSSVLRVKPPGWWHNRLLNGRWFKKKKSPKTKQSDFNCWPAIMPSSGTTSSTQIRRGGTASLWSEPFGANEASQNKLSSSEQSDCEKQLCSDCSCHTGLVWNRIAAGLLAQTQIIHG